MKKISCDVVKLPKNFAEQVLNLELLLDSGNFDINTINELMQLYTNAVEYYSGMNDVRYIHFTERIQNMLIRPEILKLMKEGKVEGGQQDALEQVRQARASMKHTRTMVPEQAASLDNQNKKAKKGDAAKKKLLEQQKQEALTK